MRAQRTRPARTRSGARRHTVIMTDKRADGSALIGATGIHQQVMTPAIAVAAAAKLTAH